MIAAALAAALLVMAAPLHHTSDTSPPSETSDTSLPAETSVPDDACVPADTSVPDDTCLPADDSVPDDTCLPADNSVPDDMSLPDDPCLSDDSGLTELPEEVEVVRNLAGVEPPTTEPGSTPTTTTSVPTTTVAPTTVAPPTVAPPKVVPATVRPATAPPTTAAPAPLATFEGSGTSVVDLGSIGAADQPVIVEITHDGSSEFVVTELNDAFEQTNLLINVIGAYDGRRVINLDDLVETKHLQVEADGAWTINVYPLRSADRWTKGELHDVGDNVFLFDGEPGVFSFAHTGDNNFVIWVVGGDDKNLAVNELGPIEGSSRLNESPVTVIIESDGRVVGPSVITAPGATPGLEPPDWGRIGLVRRDGKGNGSIEPDEITLTYA